MYNTPYFVPNFYPTIAPSMIRNSLGNTTINGLNATRGLGLFQRLGNSLKSINWTEMINNTSKTLGIINQSIPIVKQVGPMMNNMKSMLRIASIFKDETDTPKRRTPYSNKTNNSPNNNLSHYSSNNQKEETYSPTFFIP